MKKFFETMRKDMEEEGRMSRAEWAFWGIAVPALLLFIVIMAGGEA